MYLISQLFCVFMLEDTMDVTVLWVLAHFHTSRNPVFLLPRRNFTRSWYSGWIFLYLPCYEYRSLHSHPMLWAWTPRLLAQTSSYSEFIILHGTCFSGPLISCLLTCVSLCICVYTCAHTHTHTHTNTYSCVLKTLHLDLLDIYHYSRHPGMWSQVGLWKHQYKQS